MLMIRVTAAPGRMRYIRLTLGLKHKHLPVQGGAQATGDKALGGMVAGLVWTSAYGAKLTLGKTYSLPLSLALYTSLTVVTH